MRTTLNVEHANCPSCFDDTLDQLRRTAGVGAVHGSIGGHCVEIDHEGVALETLLAIVRDRLHGVEMLGNEIVMVPIEPITGSACVHLPPTARSRMAMAEATDAPRIDPGATLGDIVTQHPSLAAELERMNLDYCCHGTRTLEQAAKEVGLDGREVSDRLLVHRVAEPPAPWATLTPSALADHIESVHHRYLWDELPRITGLVDKILGVHGDHHPELADVQRLFGELRADFEPHLTREEAVLFPRVRVLDAGHGEPIVGAEDLAEMIELLEDEHEIVGALLEQLRDVTAGYAVPADGCASYDACYRALADLEADTHLHVHKENNVLLPALNASPTRA